MYKAVTQLVFADKFIKLDCSRAYINADVAQNDESNNRDYLEQRLRYIAERNRAARIGRLRDGRASRPRKRFLAFGKSQIELSSQLARHPKCRGCIKGSENDAAGQVSCGTCAHPFAPRLTSI